MKSDFWKFVCAMSNLEVFIWLFIVQEHIITSFRNDLLKARSKCDWKLMDKRFVLLWVCHYLEGFSSHFTCNTASWLIARPRVINSCYWTLRKTISWSITRIDYPWPWDKTKGNQLFSSLRLFLVTVKLSPSYTQKIRHPKSKTSSQSWKLC